MQPCVGWALLFASLTCLQGHVRWYPFVFKPQPLDTSLLGLCWHNKTLLPAKLLSVLYLSLRFSQHFLGGCSWDCGDGDLSPPLSPGCIPQTTGEDPTRRQWTAWSGAGIRPPGKLGWRPWMHNGTWWGTGTSLEAPLIRLLRTWVQIQTCLRRQKGWLITSQKLLVTAFWGEALSLSFRERNTVLCKSVLDTSES
jgi:hypothetical protein